MYTSIPPFSMMVATVISGGVVGVGIFAYIRDVLECALEDFGIDTGNPKRRLSVLIVLVLLSICFVQGFSWGSG